MPALDPEVVTGGSSTGIANADGSNARQLTDDGVDAENPTVVSGPVLFAEVSPDGRWAAFITLEVEGLESKIQVVDVASGAVPGFEVTFSTPVRSENILLGRPRWLPDGKALAFVGVDERDRTGIFAQDFDPDRDTSSTRRPLAGFLPDVTTESFGISPDGRSVTLAVMERTERLMLAEAVPGIDRP